MINKLILTVPVMITSCSNYNIDNINEDNSSVSNEPNGIFEVSARGFNGFITLTVKVDNNIIKSVEALRHDETEIFEGERWWMAWNQMKDDYDDLSVNDVINYNNNNDVSGATQSADGIFMAMRTIKDLEVLLTTFEEENNYYNIEKEIKKYIQDTYEASYYLNYGDKVLCDYDSSNLTTPSTPERDDEVIDIIDSLGNKFSHKDGEWFNGETQLTWMNLHDSATNVKLVTYGNEVADATACPSA